MLRKTSLLLLLSCMILLAGCSPFKSAKTVGDQQISSFDTVIIRDFKTDYTIIDEGFNVPGIIVGAIRRQKQFKPYYNNTRKKELARLLTDSIYSEVRSKRIFTNVFKNTKNTGNALVIEGKFNRVNVNSYHGTAPSYVSIELSGTILGGPHNQEIVLFEDEENGRITDVMREFAVHVARYLEKNYK